MKMYYIGENEHKPVDIENTLDSYYKTLDISCIDITTINLDGHNYDVICDDEALLKSDIPNVSIAFFDPLYIKCDGGIFGNVLICNSDGENETALSDNDIRIIKSHIKNNMLIVERSAYDI